MKMQANGKRKEQHQEAADDVQHGFGVALAKHLRHVWYFLALLAVLSMPLSAADKLSEKQAAEYYRLGSKLLYKQLLSANARIKELESLIEAQRFEKEAGEALQEMAKFRARVLGDAKCTVDEETLEIQCPGKKKKE